jgi:SprB repeat
MKKNLYTTGFTFLIFVLFLNSYAEIPPAGITITVDKITNTCAGSNSGAINISVTGNKGDCFYSWTGPDGYTKKSKNINNLAAGTYSITVKDLKGNSASLQIEVASFATIVVQATVTDIKCLVRITGAIDLTVSGGSGSGYTFSWNGPNGFKASTEDLSNLTAGTYNVVVKDRVDCETATTFEVSDDVVDVYENNNLLSNAKTIPLYYPIIARIAPTASDIDWYSFTTESASATYSLRVFSDVFAYTFNIYDALGNLMPGNIVDSKSKVYQSLAPNTSYYIKVNGTVANSCYNLQIEPPIEGPLLTRQVNTFSDIQIQTAKIFPNPHNGSFTLNIESPLDGIATIEIYNANGQKLNTQKQAAIKGKNLIATYQNMKGAILIYRILIGNKQLTGKIIGTN